MADTKETRTFSFDIEVREDGDAPKIRGHAAVFDQKTNIGPFEERVARGAFIDSIGTDDVRALFNHDPTHVLGRNKSGTLRMSEDSQGLAIEIDPPDTQFARDLMTSIKRGDISEMSFGFRAIKESWEGTRPKALRTLEKVRLFDVSPVTFPAYEGTDVAVRSHEQWKKENCSQNRSKIARRELDLKLAKA